ncbi:winged helix-turn-helix transcriptional regulator [Modestobacter sp. SSW1-42]|uniref:winged helix-turn-helix transcriptional regulator n=1 Tax=Modestobacter sp. SSW1-42 TaxID=596372 RepID=UPI0039857CF2
MKRYGQYCPVARAAEVLAERWTLLVVRELLWGNERFTDIARGVPRMSPSLLSARLRELQRAGLVDRRLEHGEPRYRLTPAGRELQPLVEGLGAWGQRWMHRLRPEESDPVLLMLDIGRTVDPARLPARPVTVEVRFPDATGRHRHWWLVLSRQGLDVCDVPPGSPVAAWLDTDPATLTRVWLGELSWAAAAGTGGVVLHGDSTVVRALPGWLGTSPFAAVPLGTPPLPR